jgi:hypothetical protein
VLLLATALSTFAAPFSASADSDRGPGPDEHPDRATPQNPPSDTRPPRRVAPQPGEINILAASPQPYRVFIDDFKYDELVLEGRAADVCAGRLLPGSGWTFNEIVSRFGGTAGTMYYCRERWDTASDPDCNGQIINPVTNPNFVTDCWSNHARGRAIDVMVGQAGGGYNRTRGINIVNWLLATDANGNANANARKLGIQQILFTDRCWNAEGDRGITSWANMRECGIGHHDHVHLDLSINGANGNVSYWGAAPEVHPKLDTQVFWEQSSAWREAISWFNLRTHSEEGLAVPARFDQIVLGDFNRDGTQDESLLWDTETGEWALQWWDNGDSLTARVGVWSKAFDHFYMGDLDGDGYLNDLFLWDRTTGNWSVVSWSNYNPYARSTGYLHPPWDGVYPADLDGNGLVNDFLVFDQETGKWAGYSWANWRMTLRAVDYFPRGGDVFIVGDWSAGGDLDETIYWDMSSGQYLVYAWSNFRPTRVFLSSWGPGYDLAVPGDHDSDGRTDDLFLYSSSSGNWWVFSFHRNSPWPVRNGTWGRGYDVITTGSFMD